MIEGIGYLLLVIGVGILIWAITMGAEKMIRLILANYLIGSVCFALGQSIHLRANQLATTPEVKFLRLSYQHLANFLHVGQMTFEIIVFVALVALVFRSSTITIQMPPQASTEKLYNILLIPLTLLSFVFALYFAFMAEGIVSLEKITTAITTTFPVLQSFIDHIFYRMLAHGILVIIITGRIQLKISFQKKTTILPAGIEHL